MVDGRDWRLSASSSDKWASSLRNYLAMEHLLLSAFAITFTQCIYNYVPETNHISRVPCVLFQLFYDYNLLYLHVMLFLMLNFSTSTSVLPAAVCSAQYDCFLRFLDFVLSQTLLTFLQVNLTLHCTVISFLKSTYPAQKSLQEMLRKLVRSYLGYRVDRLEIWHQLNWGRIFIRGEILQETPIITDRLFVSFIFNCSHILAPLNNAVTFPAGRG